MESLQNKTLVVTTIMVSEKGKLELSVSGPVIGQLLSFLPSDWLKLNTITPNEESG